jgi:hypothetical protein
MPHGRMTLTSSHYKATIQLVLALLNFTMSSTGDHNRAEPSKLVKFRSRGDRGSHSINALKEIFKASPLAHCAFMHDGRGLEGPDEEERPRLMNLPLLTVLREYQATDVEGDHTDEQNAPSPDELVVYLHT